MRGRRSNFTEREFDALVKEVRENYRIGMKHRAIAVRLGVSVSLIYKILEGYRPINFKIDFHQQRSRG